MARSQGFWNLMAARYARQPVADETSYKRKLEVTQTYLKPDMVALEFGCGSGTTALAHAPRLKHIQGIDYSRKMVEIARAKAREAGVGNAAFDVATIEDWPAEPGSCDVVLGLSILHLLQDMEAVIAKVRRLLRPGGLFVSSTACLGDSMRFGRHPVRLLSALRLIPFVGFFTEADLVRSLEAAGFAIDHRWRPGPDKAVFIVAKAV